MGNQQPSVKTEILIRKPKRGYGFIYKYTSPSGKSYIGQTIQTLQQRAVRGKGYRRCGLFYKAILKYGYENFEVEILEEAPCELLNDKEIEWIDFYNTRAPKGYNLSEGGLGHSKRVYQYDAETGEYINEYSSLTAAAKANNISDIQNISDCLHGRRKATFSYIWTFNKLDSVNPAQWFSHDNKKVYAYRLDGSFFKEFESITSAAKYVEGNRCDIKKNIAGKIKFSKGYIWSDVYYDSITPVFTGPNGSASVKQINKDTGEIIKIFGSQSEAARELGLSRPTGISKCCKGKAKTCAGFRWEFYEGSTTTSPQNPEGQDETLKRENIVCSHLKK